MPIVGTCADLDGGDRSLASFAASAHRPRSESWHLVSEIIREAEEISVPEGETLDWPHYVVFNPATGVAVDSHLPPASRAIGRSGAG